jgi:hypothetical protein
LNAAKRELSSLKELVQISAMADSQIGKYQSILIEVSKNFGAVDKECEIMAKQVCMHIVT